MEETREWAWLSMHYYCVASVEGMTGIFFGFEERKQEAGLLNTYLRDADLQHPNEYTRQKVRGGQV